MIGNKETETAKPDRFEHITFDDETLTCSNCNESYRINLPARIKIFKAICEAFIQLHRQCKKKMQ